MDAMNISAHAADAAAHFARRLAHETDPADLAAARASGAGPVLIDVRSPEDHAAGHIPGSVNLHRGSAARWLRSRGVGEEDEVVVYCWGPGCNGATRAAHALALEGFAGVRELIGGFEYWAREGFAVQSLSGRTRRDPDGLCARVPG